MTERTLGDRERQVRSLRTAMIPVEVRRVIDETPRVRTLILEPLDEQYAYRAGQYTELLSQDRDRTVVRQYSFSSCPAIDQLPAITVKREPSGLLSNWLFEKTGIGTRLNASRAKGTFVLDDSDRPIQLFAAGIGITPIISLCKSVMSSTSRRVDLHFTSVNEYETPFLDLLVTMSRRYDSRLAITNHYSELEGRPGPQVFREHIGRLSNAIRYVCGPASFVQLVRTAAKQIGCAPSSIITESIGRH